MAVTPIGWILLLVGPLLVVVRPRWLYVLTIFFLPFTATGVMNVGGDTEGSAVQVAMYFGSFVIVRFLVEACQRGRLPLPIRGRSSLLWLGCFTLVTAVSLMMPLWIDGHLLIPSDRIFDESSHPLFLSGHNVTGVLYMVYGFLLAYVIALVNRNHEMMRISLKSFLAGSFFSVLWAIVEFLCKVSGIEYPAFLFNTGTAGSTMGYKQVLSGGVFRLSSVAVEPSIFAQALLVAICLYLPYVLGGRCLFGRRVDPFMFLMMGIVLFLTTSSTAYVGVIFAAFILLGLLAMKGLFKVKYLVFGGVLLAFFGLLYVSVGAVQATLVSTLLSKGESGSALERLMTVQQSWEMFLQYPILGVGWGSIVSHDLIVNILANSGLLGFCCFFGAAYVLFRALYRSFKHKRLPPGSNIGQFVRMDVAVYVAFSVTLFTSILSGFLNVFSFFWFTWGLAIAVLDLDLDGVFNGRAVVSASRQGRYSMPLPHPASGRTG